MRLRPITVLATPAGADGFPAVLDALKRNGEREITIVGADSDPAAPGLLLADAGAMLPGPADPDARDATLAALCAAHRVDVVLPLTAADAAFHAGRAPDGLPARDAPGPGTGQGRRVQVATSSPDRLRTVLDRLALLRACAQAGVPCPRFRPMHTVDELPLAAADMGWPRAPFVLRLNQGTGPSAVKIVDPGLAAFDRLFDRDNLRVRFPDIEAGLTGLDRLPDMHVTEYLPGPEYSVDVLCRDGEVLAAVVRDHRAARCGRTTRTATVDHPVAAKAAAEVVRCLGLSFLVSVAFRCDAAGTPRLLGVDPGVPGAVGLSAAAGINLPYLAVKLALGEPLGDIVPPVAGTELVRYPGAAVRHPLNGPPAADPAGLRRGG